MINSIGELMTEHEFIDSTYILDVIEREKMSSTIFNNRVAVPHSMHMTALKSAIAIVINKKPQKWEDSNVQLIAFIAFNRDERKLFTDIYDSFIRIISEPENIDTIVASKDYEDFIEKLTSLMPM